MPKILIGADIVPTESNVSLFREGDASALVGENLLRLFREADYSVLNLEVPLTDKKTPIAKCGPNLIAPADTVQGLKALGVSFLALANNHILDQDVQGLVSTVKSLEENGIAHAGTGDNLQEAKKPYVVNVHGIRIGIYCCAEHEFSIAGGNRPGANPFDPLESFDHVRALRSRCDLLLVLYHGGKEHYRYPSPMLRKVFRKFASCGADFVIAQHTHCIGCEEVYQGSRLVYGQGNFLFDRSDSEFWQTSLLMVVSTDGKGHACEYIPLRKHGETVRAAEGTDRENILAEFQARSREIEQDSFVERRYAEFAEEMRNTYLQRLSGNMGRFLPVRVLNRLCGRKLFGWLHGKEARLDVENCLDCEAHRELLLTGLRLK